ncbi:MAG: NAD(P)-dependent oxidoreductase [Candidatus Bathyarchaeota archaeon]|nr:NAD(P)-dependent oxidoreductase [Candidatus Bathyarchaeota archaeon]
MSTMKAEAERCLKCKVPGCAKGCPASTPIPQVFNLFLEGKLKEAGEMLFNNNPLSAVTSIICPHERNCKGHCILGKKGQPVEFYKVEQYISRFYLETFQPPLVEKNGKTVGVVGAGPAGMTMSIILALKGYSITLFEAMDSIGGTLRYGIPEFRLPKNILELYKKILDSLDVKFRPNTRIGTNITTEDMFLDGYDAIFICTGTSRPNRYGLLGETLGHVHFAIDYLRSPDAYKLGKKVVILGAGNVAMDAARTAIRKQHSEVTILNNRSVEEISADKAEVEMATIDGVKMLHDCQAVRITEDSVKCVKIDKTIAEDGSVNYKEDFQSSFEVPTDSVIIAIGQGPGADVVSVGSAKVTQRGLLQVDEFGRTSQKGVFAAGDVVTGPKTVIEAVAFAKKASEKIEEYCNNL